MAMAHSLEHDPALSTNDNPSTGCLAQSGPLALATATITAAQSQRLQWQMRQLAPRGPKNPLSRPKNDLPFDYDLFRKPSSEYRGCPFWAWNARLDHDQLLRQIDYMHEMGLGGFHMHSRVGLDTPYLQPEFMDMVKACVNHAEKKGMLACLYDEDRWPSGTAGGIVTGKSAEYCGKRLRFTSHSLGSDHDKASQRPPPKLLARYLVRLDKAGCLQHSYVVDEKDPDGTDPESQTDDATTLWYAYVETRDPSDWFNGNPYVDTLNHTAMSEFIKSTHEVYKAHVGDKFGSTVPCIFTDEPQFESKGRLADPRAWEDILIPWTNDLPSTFSVAYQGLDLVRNLPDLFWDLPDDKPSLVRYRYHDHVAERFVNAFADQIAEWCDCNGLMLNGHMMEEPTLQSQTAAIGEAMRCYRNMQIPGIDLLSDAVEYNTAKQASSVARQNGIGTCMCEIYGCTHWTFTFEGHKGSGDWQAALGINFRVHHLAWLSMSGEAKRDYPASINYQSPWYKEYPLVEDHFARVSVALTRGRAVTRVAVVHPIESFWLSYGPRSNQKSRLQDQAFHDLTEWLLRGLVDFDFVSESLLPGQYDGVENKRLLVGKCLYDVVILPSLTTIRSTTIHILLLFAAAGGKVIVAGSAPTLIDGLLQPHDSVKAALEIAAIVPWTKSAILESLEPFKDIKFLFDDSTQVSNEKETDSLLYQMRQDGPLRYIFICNQDRNYPRSGTLSIKGRWHVQELDTISGEATAREGDIDSGWTRFHHKFDGCGSILLCLSPPDPNNETSAPLALPAPDPAAPLAAGDKTETVKVSLVSTKLSGQNAFMLDIATYKVDGGPWKGPTEILRLENDIRDVLKLPRKGGSGKQPWSIPVSERKPVGQVTVQFEFESKVDLEEPISLVLEIPTTDCVIRFNGERVDYGEDKERSWWVDEAIIVLPSFFHGKSAIRKGKNTLSFDFPFGIMTSIERLYLLGSFDTTFVSKVPVLETAKLSKQLDWGDITKQGLPFYVDNVDYHIEFTLDGPLHATLWVPHFSTPVLAVWKEDDDTKAGTKVGNIAFQPRQLELGNLPGGKHRYRITAFGNRYNAFGHIHTDWGGCWPDVWRSQNWSWTDEYLVKPIGVLECPHVQVRDVKSGSKVGSVVQVQRKS